MNKKLIIIIILVLIIGGGGFAAWYFTNRNQSSSSNNPTSNSSNSTQDKATQNSTQNNQTAKTYPVFVYFSKHPDSDNDPSKTFPLRRISPDLGVASFAITQLLKGPTSAEASQGYFTTAHLRTGAAVSDFKLTISGGTATLQFLKPFDHLGVIADGQADSEIKTTLKQFSNIQKVIILDYQGNCEFDLSGQNLCKQ